MANESLSQLSDALGIATARLSGDPQRMQMALGMQQSRKLQEEAAARQQKLQQFAQANPSLSKMYELFGEKGLQQGYLQQQETQQKVLQEQQTRQNLKQQGFTDRQIELFMLTGDPEFAFKDLQGLSGEKIIESVEENVEKTTEQTGVLDTFANLDEAFGPLDATQELISKGTRVLGFDVESETGAAIRARNSLNTEILANLAADFTGRPNMLIYENIKGNLPMNAATSESDAREKYENVKDQVDARIANLKEGLKSSFLSDKDKNSYREELDKSITLSKKLDSAILSLSSKKEETLEPTNLNMQSEGFYSWIYE